MFESLELNDGRLGQKQIARYWNDGFLFPLPALSEKAALEARQELQGIERDWLDAGLPLPLTTYKRINSHVVMPMAARIAKDPGILDVVEGILGPDILIFSTEFFIKEPRSTQIVSMHQDLTYWGLGAIDGLLTAWIALSPATPRSGCMDFVKASHKNAILPHDDSFDKNNLLSRGQEVRVDVKPEDKVAIEIHPGQMSFHHGLTIHGSGPNTSDDRRIACVVRYIRPDMTQKTGEKDYAMLARGEDNFGNFALVPEPEENFSPQSLSMYEDIRSNQAKIMMKGTPKTGDFYS